VELSFLAVSRLPVIDDSFFPKPSTSAFWVRFAKRQLSENRFRKRRSLFAYFVFSSAA
jgi:hypothetical protein